jgi:hypothetical protein
LGVGGTQIAGRRLVENGNLERLHLRQKAGGIHRDDDEVGVVLRDRLDVGLVAIEGRLGCGGG